MTPEEVRAEVERRKKRVKDLKIREILWGLRQSFDHMGYWLEKDPAFAARLIFPGVELSGNKTRFSIEQARFQLSYNEGRVTSEDSGHRGDETKSTEVTLTLKLNRETVFQFEVRKNVTYTHVEPIFSEHMGETVSFIEGPWVTEIADFAVNVDAHAKAAWKERDAPREAKEAEDLKKRFGL